MSDRQLDKLVFFLIRIAAILLCILFIMIDWYIDNKRSDKLKQPASEEVIEYVTDGQD